MRDNRATLCTCGNPKSRYAGVCKECWDMIVQVRADCHSWEIQERYYDECECGKRKRRESRYCRACHGRKSIALANARRRERLGAD